MIVGEILVVKEMVLTTSKRYVGPWYGSVGSTCYCMRIMNLEISIASIK